MSKNAFRRLTVIFYWLVIIALAGLFFTNDFGLVDIHKTAIVVAVGLDCDGDDITLTAQLAIPQPSQSGENIQYSEVSGSGATVSEALAEINSKTGFYSRLVFCKLVLLGDSCAEKNIFQVLGCFYRSNFSELTAQVAMCEGKASEMLALPATVSPETSTAIQRVLSDELKKSGDVASVSLKDIAALAYSESAACFMPYIQAETGGKESGEGGGQYPSEGSEGGGDGGGESVGKSGGSGEPAEFMSKKTAVFADGVFAGVLDERQSFALNLLRGRLRLAVLPCETGGVQYAVSLKGLTGSAAVRIKEGKPVVTFKVRGHARIQGAAAVLDPDRAAYDDVVKEEVLACAEAELKSRLSDLTDTCARSGCDIIGTKSLLYRRSPKRYAEYAGGMPQSLTAEYDIDIKSVN